MESGLIHVYMGEGKGKTTAALGLGLRACGRGRKVLLLQFLKGRDSGELKSIACLPNFDVIKGPERLRFFGQMNQAEKDEYQAKARVMFSQAKLLVEREECNLLILDEGLDAIHCGIVSEMEIVDFLKNKPVALEVVITGRNPPGGILNMADYITEMIKVRHPYDKGTPARIGIEK